MITPRPAVLLAVSCLAGCAATPVRPTLLRIDPPAQANAAAGRWERYDTPAFTLFTDLSRADADATAQALAAELAAVRAALDLKAPPNSRFEIVVYASSRDFMDRFGPTVSAASRLDDADRHPILYLWGPPAHWDRNTLEGNFTSRGSVLRQTLAHAVLVQAVSPQPLPRWLMHGLGAYVETLAWSEDGQRVQLGALNTTLSTAYRKNRAVGFADVTGMPQPHPGGEQAYAQGYEGYCWALVFTLQDERPDMLKAYVSALAQGRAAAPDALFDGSKPEEIDAHVQKFLRKWEPRLRQVPVAQEGAVATVGDVTPEELARVSPAPAPTPWQ
jgi:hypothetical protein